MSPSKVRRDRLLQFTDLPNIGPASAQDFVQLGYTHPLQLTGADPLVLYDDLCRVSGVFQDPCVLVVLMSVTDFLAGQPPRAWWHYTAQRRQQYGDLRARAAALRAIAQ